MKVVGITGRSGCGKSSATNFLREKGYPCIDADLVAREVLLPGSPCIAQLQQVFGADIADENGTVRRRLLADKPHCAEILALQAVKLFGLFCLPYLCIRFMGLSPLSFLQVQLLTSLMLFLSNALPNVAGMGSIETAFLLVFGSFLERGEVMSVMMLYRIASYYVVFAASAVGFFIAQRHLGQMGAEPPKEA